MFGIGMPEMILILAVALIVIGPKKLPDLAKSVGKAMREFKKATHEIKESLEVDDDIADIKKNLANLDKNETPPEPALKEKDGKPSPSVNTIPDPYTESEADYDKGPEQNSGS